MKASDHKVPIEGEKIVLARDMAAYEKLLIDGNPKLSETFMDIAALGLYKVLENKVLDLYDFKEIILLIGKGNNGGDGYALGSLLLRGGYEVTAYELFDEISDLSKKKSLAFEKDLGSRVLIEDAKSISFSDDMLVIDGLLGTGFKGEVTGLMAEVIEECNSHENFVFSIDIPSGVAGDTGIVKGSAIYADMTGYLGALKVGHLFEDGYEHVGCLNFIDFGMDITHLFAENNLANPAILYHNLPRRSRSAHKYSVGQVCIIAGSKEMPGAADLACMAAYRTGCGIVRHFSLGDRSSMKEVIFHPYSREALDKEVPRTKSILIGPGLGREDTAKEIVDEILQFENVPMVIDADALFLMEKPPKNSILTPHRGELMHLLKIEQNLPDKDMLDKTREYVDKNNVHIIYKGVPTVILSPHKKNIVIVTGNPGMATGGSGDVLSGIVASLLAQGSSPHEAAALSVLVHGKAGSVAATKLSERYMLATDIVDSLSQVFLELES